LSKCLPIFTIFTPLESTLNFQQNPYNISHLTHTTLENKRLIYQKNQGIVYIIIPVYGTYVLSMPDSVLVESVDQ